MSKLTHSTDEGMRQIEERRARKDGEVQAWKRVYQGGHHDVWCDGETHKRTYGGFCHPDNPAGFNDPGHEFKCNCAYYQREKLIAAAPDMLAALRQAEIVLRFLAEHLGKEEREVHPQVLAAIARAEGRTP